MDSVTELVREQRKNVLEKDENVYFFVTFYTQANRTYVYDIDGALPTLVDAVLLGLSDVAKRAPDHRITLLVAQKMITCDEEHTLVVVNETTIEKQS